MAANGAQTVRYDSTGKWIQIGRWWVRLSDRYRLLVIQGGTNPSWTQEDFRFRNDDGDLATATWIDGETTNNIDKTIAVDTTTRLRIVVQQTVAAKAVNNQTFELWASYESGNYIRVTTTSNYVQLVNDANSIADHATTVQRIGDGNYSAPDAQGYNDGQTDDDTGVIDFVGADEVEIEFTFQIYGPQVSDGETIDFQIYLSGGTALNSAPDPPRATASNVTNPQIDEDADITIGESTTVTPLVLPNLSESDDITLADTVIDIAVQDAAARTIDETDDVTIGENVTASLDDLVIDTSDGITITDTIDDLTVEGGVEPDRDIDETDDITFGENVTCTLDDLVIDVSDGLTVGDSETVSDPFEPMIPIDLGVDNMSVWKQGVVVYG